MSGYVVSPALLHRLRLAVKSGTPGDRNDVAELVEAYTAMRAVLRGFADHVDDVTAELAAGDPFRTGEIREAAKEILRALAERRVIFAHGDRRKEGQE